jgi:hypothetical protein
MEEIKEEIVDRKTLCFQKRGIKNYAQFLEVLQSLVSE